MGRRVLEDLRRGARGLRLDRPRGAVPAQDVREPDGELGRRDHAPHVLRAPRALPDQPPLADRDGPPLRGDGARQAEARRHTREVQERLAPPARGTAGADEGGKGAARASRRVPPAAAADPDLLRPVRGAPRVDRAAPGGVPVGPRSLAARSPRAVRRPLIRTRSRACAAARRRACPTRSPASTCSRSS